MRRLLILVLLSTATPAHAWEPPVFRHATQRDLRDGEGPDRWVVGLADPRTGRGFQLTAGAGEGEAWMAFSVGTPFHGFGQFRTMPLLVGFRRVQDDGGDLELRRVRGGWRLRGGIQGQYRIDLRIRGGRPGPTLQSRYPEAFGLRRRAVPVMDGIANGRIELISPYTGSARVRSWPLVVVHDWWVGDGPPYECCGAPGGDPYPRCCQATDVVAARGRGGVTLAVGGHTVTREGGIGWSGVVARRHGGRLRWCRAKLHLREFLHWGDESYPKKYDARCGGMRVRLDEVGSVRGEQFRVGGGRARGGIWLWRTDWTTQFVE